MRAMALICLLLAQEPDIDALLKQLYDESIEVREKATAALIELGPGVDDRIKKEAATAQGELKSRLDAVLFAIGHRRRLESVLPPLRRVTLEAKDRPLRDAIDEFKTKSGLFVKLAGAGDARVTVSLRDALPVEALDAICRAAGVGYGCTPNLDLVISGKYSITPRVFAGRYAISAAGLGDFEKTTGGWLVLALFWPGDVRPCAQPVLDVMSATDDAGGSLLLDDKKTAPGLAISSPGRKDAVPHRLGAQVWLKVLSKGATKIASIKGRLRMNYSVPHFVSFDTPDGDQKLDYDGVTLDLKNFSHLGDEVKFNLDLAGRRRHAGAAESRWCIDGLMRIDGHKVFVKAEGDTESSPSEWSGGPTETGWRLNFTFKGIKAKATAIRIEVDGVQFEDVVDFEIKDIPFPK